MKVNSATAHYLLLKEFGDIVSKHPVRSVVVDYPILYDEKSDMSGHVVLIPSHERPNEDVKLHGALCVCMGDGCAHAAEQAGFAVVRVDEGATFQQMYNYMQAVAIGHERLDAQLRAYVDAYAGFEPLVDACARHMGCPCILVDRQYRIVCLSNWEESDVRLEQGDEHGMHKKEDETRSPEVLESDIIDLFMASRGYQNMRSSPRVFAMPGSDSLLMLNVFSRGLPVGTLIMKHEGYSLSARHVRFVLTYLAGFVEEMYQRIGSFGMLHVGAGYVKSSLHAIALGESVDYRGIESALIRNGHGDHAAYVVLRVERTFTNEGPEERDYLARRFELIWPNAYCFEGEDQLFVLADTGMSRTGSHLSLLDDLPAVARDNLCKVGVSQPFSELEQIGPAIVQATAAFEQGNANDSTHWCYRFKDYALSWIIERVKGDISEMSICHPAVMTLMRHDAYHGTDLLVTLSVFLRSRYNATAAAAELYVARSTLLNRLERIEELTHLDLSNFDERIHVALSLRMLAF
jgi:hypothetical protein